MITKAQARILGELLHDGESAEITQIEPASATGLIVSIRLRIAGIEEYGRGRNVEEALAQARQYLRERVLAASKQLGGVE